MIEWSGTPPLPCFFAAIAAVASEEDLAARVIHPAELRGHSPGLIELIEFQIHDRVSQHQSSRTFVEKHELSENAAGHQRLVDFRPRHSAGAASSRYLVKSTSMFRARALRRTPGEAHAIASGNIRCHSPI